MSVISVLLQIPSLHKKNNHDTELFFLGGFSPKTMKKRSVTMPKMILQGRDWSFFLVPIS